MNCIRPYIREYGERVSQWACYSKCLPCLINRRRIWTSRLILEAYTNERSCFATLTYSDNKLPRDGSLQTDDYAGWIKRLRQYLPPRSLRFFISGEYGPRTLRPHYHAILFGIDRFTAGGLDGQSGLVKKTWDYGNTGGYTYVGDTTEKSCAYVAGYVTKKLSNKKDDRLSDKRAEFTRMSLRPGIGKFGVGVMASNIRLAGIGRDVFKDGLPTTLRYGDKGYLPLGKYVREKLSLEMAKDFVGDTCTPDPRKKIIELQELRRSDENEAKALQTSVEKIRLDKAIQLLHNLEQRELIYHRNHTL